MNREELVNRFYFDNQRLFDEKIQRIAFRQQDSFVLQGQRDLTVIEDSSKLQFVIKTRLIAGFEQTRTQMPVDLYRGSDGDVAQSRGSVFDECQGPLLLG